MSGAGWVDQWVLGIYTYGWEGDAWPARRQLLAVSASWLRSMQKLPVSRVCRPASGTQPAPLPASMPRPAGDGAEKIPDGLLAFGVEGLYKVSKLAISER